MPNVNISKGDVRSILVVCMFVAALALLLPGLVPAQGTKKTDAAKTEAAKADAAKPDAFNYCVDEVNLTLRNKQNEILNMLSDRNFRPVTTGEKTPSGEPKTLTGEAFIKYFTDNYYLARWTQKANFSNIPKYRDEMKKILIGSKSSTGQPNLVYIYFRDKALLPGLERLAKGNCPDGKQYHPDVRVNAMLAIGELNDVEGDPTKAAELPPTPLPAAMRIMLAAVEAPLPDINGDQDVARLTSDDAVRVAAIVGIMRNIRYTKLKNPDSRTPVLKAMYKLIRANEIPAGRSPSTHSWLRAQAAEVLGELGDLGAKGAVANALAEIVKDSDLTESGEPKVMMSTRCTAARAMSNLNYSSGSGGLEPMPWALALCKLARDACPAVEDQNYSPIKLRECMTAVESGLSGFESLMNIGEQKATMTEIKAIFKTITQSIGNKEPSAASKELVECREKLNELLAKQ
jgi:hypothetical protein